MVSDPSSAMTITGTYKYSPLRALSRMEGMPKARQETFAEKYEITGPSIGQGGFGNIFPGVTKLGRSPVAIKVVPIKRNSEFIRVPYGSSSRVRVPLEIYLLQKVSNIDGVVKFLDCFTRKDSYLIIMERLERVRDLFDYIGERKFLDEVCSQRFLRQIVQTVLKCHEAGVVHRDIKDENILVNLVTLKLTLIDFGAGAIVKNEPFTDYHGTDVYAPREWFSHHSYDGAEGAVWSLGILLYAMLCGDVPFPKTDQILEARLKFENERERRLSPACMDLIRQCLHKNPKRRITLEGILSHPWMKSNVSISNSESGSEEMLTTRRINEVSRLTIGNQNNSLAMPAAQYSSTELEVAVQMQQLPLPRIPVLRMSRDRSSQYTWKINRNHPQRPSPYHRS